MPRETSPTEARGAAAGSGSDTAAGAAADTAAGGASSPATPPALRWAPWELPDLGEPTARTLPSRARQARPKPPAPSPQDTTASEPHDASGPAPPDAVSRSRTARPRLTTTRLTLPGAALARAERASIEVARFDAEIGASTVDSALAERFEAACSARLEGLWARAEVVGLAELGGRRDRRGIAVTRTQLALRRALDATDALDSRALMSIEALLTGSPEPGPIEQWAAGSLQSAEAASVGLDLMSFSGREDVPVLARAAIGYAQFETADPLGRSDGRVGRAIFQATLRAAGVTKNAAVPLSAGLLARSADWDAALARFRTGDLAAVIGALTDSVLAGIAIARSLRQELHSIRASWQDLVRARQGATAWRLADLLIGRPVVTAPIVGQELGIHQQNAQRTITPLVEAGILTECTGRQRDRIWQAPEVASAFDACVSRLQP